jgi:hypothetical protein
MLNPDEEIYTDLVLEILSAYLFAQKDGEDLAAMVLHSIREDHKFEGKGLLEGLLFSSILHMAMMISFLSLSTGISNADVLKKYALVYKMTRDDVAKMPQVHPEFISKIVDRNKDIF